MSEKTEKEKTIRTIVPKGWLKIPSSHDEKPAIIGTKCRKCGQYSFPPRVICMNCFSEDLEKTELSNVGKLYSFTVVRTPRRGFTVPYALGHIDLPEGVRITTQIVDVDLSKVEEELKTGMDMELILGKIRTDAEGNDLISYQFKPLRSAH